MICTRGPMGWPSLQQRAARWSLRACDRVGARPEVKGRAEIENQGRLTVGDDLMLHGEPATIHLATGPRGTLEIGHGVEIGHGSAISAQIKVQLGDRVVVGPFALILDSDFHQIGDRTKDGTARAIEIGHDVHVGPRVTLLRGARIGDGARLGAGSVVAGEVAPGAVIDGVPTQVAIAAQELRACYGPQAVAELVRRTLGLAQRPGPELGPDDLEGWDSLGTLNLLLALEESFAVTLDPSSVLRVRSVGDLAALVDLATRPAFDPGASSLPLPV